MASMPNPAASALSRSIIDGLANKNQSQAPSPMGGQSPEGAGDMLSQRMAELGGADPGMVLRKLTQMKQEVIALIPQLAMKIPGMSKHLPTLLKSIDGAIDEIGKASQTEDTVRKSMSPIGSSIASSPQPQPNEMGPMGGGGMSIPGLG